MLNKDSTFQANHFTNGSIRLLRGWSAVNLIVWCPLHLCGGLRA